MMKEKLDIYKNAIENNYRNWGGSNDNFTVGFNEGRKYIKVVIEHSVHSFIVNTKNDSKFRYGDILKAASWNAPARNFARGNVFENYTVRWTGA